MDGPIQRDGSWWQRANGGWYRWHAHAQLWEAQSHGPPPPGPPPASVGAAPAASTRGAVAVSDAPVTSSTRFDETWGTVRVRPDDGEWSPSLGSVTATRSRPGNLGVWVLAAVGLVVLGAVGYLKFVKSDAPTGEAIDAAFTSLNGFEYQAVPEAQIEEAEEELRAHPTADEVFVDLDGRLVLEQGRFAGVVMIMGVDPDEMEPLTQMEGTAEEAFLAGLRYGIQQDSGLTLEQAGISTTTVTRAGARVWELTSAHGAAAFFFDHQDGFVFVVGARDTGTMRSVTRQLAKGNIEKA